MKKKIPFIVTVAVLSASLCFFLFTEDLRFGFIATWCLMAIYAETIIKACIGKIEIRISAPDAPEDKEEKKDEGDCDRD